MENTINFIKKHGDLFTFLGLLLLCYFIFFFNIGNYALMDVDETRYVSMARDMFHSKDFLTLYLKSRLYIFGVNVCHLLCLVKLTNLLQDFLLRYTELFQRCWFTLQERRLFQEDTVSFLL